MSASSSDERPEAILQEWFGRLEPDGSASKDKRDRWFSKDPSFDAHIRKHFEDDVRRALTGEYDGWTTTARGSLALVILLDQMTRNMFRDTAEMYCGDPPALAVTLGAIERRIDMGLRFIERHFLYLPLMHGEDVATQDRCIEAFERLAADGGRDAVSFAHGHRDIVVRFGRFPHRNVVLGRESSPEELEFLQQPNSSF